MKITNTLSSVFATFKYLQIAQKQERGKIDPMEADSREVCWVKVFVDQGYSLKNARP
jgi:hypothetical protein